MLVSLVKPVAYLKNRVTIITHDALNATSLTSQALEELRREAERAKGQLTVFSADAGAGSDRLQYPLLHAKLVMADQSRLVLGSANLTSYALFHNLEAGILLGRAAAKEASAIIGELIKAHLVYLVFAASGHRAREGFRIRGTYWSLPSPAFQTGRPEAVAPGHPVRREPPPACAACPGGAWPRSAWL